jgi:hypothetical protein
VRQRALAHVGDDFGIVPRLVRDACAREEMAFVEDLEGSKTVGKRVHSSL